MSNMQQNGILHPIILKFCALGALSRFVLIYSIYIMFFASIGLNPAVIGGILATYEVGKLIGDLIFATMGDKYGRKNMIILGFLFKACGIASWIILPGIHTSFIGAFLIGSGKSGINNIESYMYDELKANNIMSNFRNSLALKSIMTNISASLGGFCTSGLYQLGGFRYVFLASIAVMAFISIPYIIFCLKDQKLYTKENNKKNIFLVGKAGLMYTLQNRKIFYTVILVSIFYSAYIIYTDTNKIVMNNIGLTPDVIAKIYAIAHIVPVITTLIFLLVKPGMLIRSVVTISIAMWAGIGVNAYFMYGKPVISAILLYLFLFPIFDTCIRDNLHRLILDSSIRSTVISFSQLVSSALNIVASLTIGVLAYKYSYSISVTIFSIGIVALTVLIMILQKVDLAKRRNVKFV